MNLKEKAEELWGRLKGEAPELFREAMQGWRPFLLPPCAEEWW